MGKFFVMMSVVFVMAFGFVGNASAGEDFVGVFAHDITGGLVDKDFLETDDVLEDEDISIVGKSVILPFVVTHDIVKGGFLTIFGTVGGAVYGSAVAADYVADSSAVVAGHVADGSAVAADYVVDGSAVVAGYVADGSVTVADYVVDGSVVVVGYLVDGSAVVVDYVGQIFQ